MNQSGDIPIPGHNHGLLQKLIWISQKYWENYYTHPSKDIDSQTISKSVSKSERESFYNNEPRNCLYKCNTWEYDDGSKYVGYLARENGKYGSYPLCDDYGDESFP